MKKKQLNLTSGPILRTLSELALPIMASSFLSTAYNITDMAWIGMLGSKAVAGVGVGGMYVWLSQGLSSLARMGGQVNMAHSLGRGDQKAAKEVCFQRCFGIALGCKKACQHLGKEGKKDQSAGNPHINSGTVVSFCII